MIQRTTLFGAALAAALVCGVFGCGPKAEGGSTATGGGAAKTASNENLSGTIKIDGSTTVFPVMQAVTDTTAFGAVAPNVRVAAGDAGTGSGFQKFMRGEIDIATASRPIEPEEIEAAKAANIEYVEIPIAFDGLSVIVNKDNAFIDSITLDELRKLWGPGSTVKTWADLRAGLPAEEIKLYGPTTNHGTFDYFTEVVNGKKGSGRTDYQQIQQYNQLIQGVGGDRNALGYVGFAYVEQNLDKVKAISVDAGKGAIVPSKETIENQTYAPLSRPLFLYVNKKSLDRPEIKAFLDYVLGDGRQFISETGYVALSDEAYALIRERVAAGTVGSIFRDAKPGQALIDVLKGASAAAPASAAPKAP